MRRFRSLVALALVGCLWLGNGPVRAEPAGGVFDSLVDAYFNDHYALHPTQATSDGFHEYDDRVDDASQDAIHSEVQMLHDYRDRFAALDEVSLSPDQQSDRELMVANINSQLLTLEVIRGWQKDPDSYSSGLSSMAFSLISRTFASPERRLTSLIAREKAMPAVLAEAKANLNHCPKVFTEMAIQDLPDNISFFQNDVPAAFKGVTSPTLQADFQASNAAVIAALQDYQSWLKSDLLPRSDGDFRIGEKTYALKLSYDEMVDLPLDRILQIGLDNMHANQRWFKAVAHDIDPHASPHTMLVRLQHQHPPGDQLLATFRHTLIGLRAFIVAHHLLTIPSTVMPTLEESPPFDRATTMASMDIPGAYERVAHEAYFNVTLPEASWSATQTEEFLQGFNYGTIISTASHEAFPGHYIQYLYLQRQKDKVRKLVTCTSCSEGWAHYCEQMMLDEGYGHGDKRMRLGQLTDALLRNARLVVGIQMHRGRMTMAQATDFFVKEGYQTPADAKMEVLRGTSDPTYLYYTVGKLEIMKLRTDYLHQHPGATLQDFHNAFLKQGIIPIKLIRRSMLGAEGSVL